MNSILEIKGSDIRFVESIAFIFVVISAALLLCSFGETSWLDYVFGIVRLI